MSHGHHSGAVPVLISSNFPPEPPKSVWQRWNLPATPWVTVPILFIEILVMVVPSASLPDIFLDFFNHSYPLSAISKGVADSFGGILAFLLSPLFGVWADKYGRKPLVLWLSAISFLPILCLAFYPGLSLWAYLATRGFAKLSAFGLLFSAVSDVTPATERARYYAQTSGLGMAAVCIGPVISLTVDAVWSFRVSAILSLAVLIYVQVFYPETLWIGLRRMEKEEKERVEMERRRKEEQLNNIGGGEFFKPDQHQRQHQFADSMDTTNKKESDDLRASLLIHSAATSDSAADSNDESASSSLPVSYSYTTVTAGDGPPGVIAQLIVQPPSQNRSINGGGDMIEKEDIENSRNPGGMSSSSSSSALALPSSSTPSISTSSVNPFISLSLAFSSPLHRRIGLILLFSQLSQNGIMECAMLYLKLQLHFTRHDNSILLLVMGIWAVVVNIVIMPLMLRRGKRGRSGIDEKYILLFALLMDFIHQTLYMLIPDKKYFYFICFCQGFGFMAYPASNAILSGYVSDAEQGQIMSMSQGIRSITQGLAPILFNGLFSYFTWSRAPVFLPQAPFLLSSLCILIAFTLTLRLPSLKVYLREKKRLKEMEEEGEEVEGMKKENGNGINKVHHSNSNSDEPEESSSSSSSSSSSTVQQSVVDVDVTHSLQ